MAPTRRAYLAATLLAAALAGCSSGTDSGTIDSVATNEPTDISGKFFQSYRYLSEII